MGNNNTVQLGVKPKKKNKITIAAIKNSALTRAKTHFCKGKMYFGMYTFLTNADEFSIDDMADEVDSTVKVYIKDPVK
jgi:hypothetical protein